MSVSVVSAPFDDVDKTLTYTCTNWYNKPVGDGTASGSCYVKAVGSGVLDVDYMPNGDVKGMPITGKLYAAFPT